MDGSECSNAWPGFCLRVKNSGHALIKTAWVPEAVRTLRIKKTHFFYTRYSLFARVRFRTPIPRNKQKSVYNWGSLKQCFSTSLFFYLQKHCDWCYFVFPLQLLEHHTLSLEDLFELSNSFDDLIRWRIWVMYFYPWGVPADFRNREVRTLEKRVISVLS